MLPASSQWSIDFRSGHCKHPKGLDAFIGANDSNRFTPVLGPYVTRDLSEAQIARAMRDLIGTIEQSDEYGIVAFGTIDNALLGNTVSVIGIEHPWIPDPSARTNWLFKCRPNDPLASFPASDLMGLIEDEWTISDTNHIVHHSDIEFFFTRDCISTTYSRMLAEKSGTVISKSDSDTSIFHPDLIDDSIYALAKTAYSVISEAYALNLPGKLLRLDIDVATNTLNI